VLILLGKHHFENLYHKNHTTKQFEAYAKKRGLTVIALGRVSADGVLSHAALNWMIDPLPNTKQEHAEKTEKGVSLWDKIKLRGETRDHATSTKNGECVPPVTYLKPGEWITHIAVKSPNDQELSHAAGDSRQPKTRSENGPA
jgi:hypothetical protein